MLYKDIKAKIRKQLKTVLAIFLFATDPHGHTQTIYFTRATLCGEKL